MSQKRVARRMKILGLKSITIKKFNHASTSKIDNTREYPNLLEQDFNAEKPGQKWVGDITYIYTNETGWTYLAIVLDLFDLKVIGWNYGVNMNDDLVIEAFKKALNNRCVNENGIFHSDRGSQYTSKDFEKLLTNYKIKHSYSKKGYPYDNASMESFNSILKKEEVNLNKYKTFNEAKMAIFEFIESWYNNQRIHSTLDYITPNEKFNNYIKTLAAIWTFTIMPGKLLIMGRVNSSYLCNILFWRILQQHFKNWLWDPLSKGNWNKSKCGN